MPATSPIEAVADRLVAMLETGQPSEVLDHVAPGALLWHNDGKGEIDAVAGIEAVVGLHQLVADVRVEVLDQFPLPDGFGLRYVLRGTVRQSGTPLAAHHCIFVRTDGGRITRIDEYVDPTLLTQLGLTEPQEVPS
jgi:hypothetical protein